MIVADSDVLIDYLRGREPSFGRIQLELGTGRLATTSVNAFELLSGAGTERELEKVQRLLAAMVILPVDSGAAREAAAARRELERAGRGIGMADYLIAGVCLAHRGILITRNVDHFGRVPGLSLSARLEG
jgi:tRNA(fMet)-specific endonuclease VapC